MKFTLLLLQAVDCVSPIFLFLTHFHWMSTVWITHCYLLGFIVILLFFVECCLRKNSSYLKSVWFFWDWLLIQVKVGPQEPLISGSFISTVPTHDFCPLLQASTLADGTITYSQLCRHKGWLLPTCSFLTSCSFLPQVHRARLHPRLEMFRALCHSFPTL